MVKYSKYGIKDLQSGIKWVNFPKHFRVPQKWIYNILYNV